MAKTGDGESLGTAEGAVMGRAAHALHAEDPVLDDHWAIHLLGEASRAQVTSPDYLALSIERAGFDASRILAIGVGALRYAEDEVERCVARGVGQYVILGAGFDTFALRRADLVDRLVVFEVDHPDVQALKRSRIEAAAETPASLPRFVPVDFETTTLEAGLSAAGFDPDREAIFSFMNTTPYLTEEAIEATLSEIARLAAPGSRIVLNYGAEVPLSAEQVEYLETLQSNVRASGEPWRSRFRPEAFEALLERVGFVLIEHATEADLFERYFAGRRDGFRPGVPGRLVTAEVAPRG
ncbi:MAG TPA: SAM-dependent methyltransferase [Myxococcota bacterium]|nr:class I SAM-dependent methyltransferase [Myxococcales bacterium]HPG27186.1 SAM-dependent methyltransferase [Myxococcota bacterium]